MLDPRSSVLLLVCLASSFSMAQPPGFGPPPGPPGRGGPGGPGGPGSQRATSLVDRFDADENGWLDASERDRARAWLDENRRGRRRRGARRPPRGFGDDGRRAKGKPERLSPADVPAQSEAGLYDPTALRTFFIDFAEKDWKSELEAFYRTDVDVPATLTVDGRVYEGVGVRYRGNSSFFSVASDLKRSLNLAMDLVHGDQRLYGYKTLNLLNAHSDPSFLREAIYNRICREYLPAPKTGFAKVVINGESWGVYVNAQQFNKDFLSDWFSTKKGTRWKVPANFRGDGALVYLGEDRAAYERAYALKTRSRDAAKTWGALIELCRVLEETHDADLAHTLPLYLDVDRALWFLALDNVFMDGDGYYSRGSDYALYRDRSGVFHALPHDSNETFRAGGGGPGGPRISGFRLDPLMHQRDADRPLVSRLLAVPAWRARYLAHVKTLVDTWLDWDRLGPELARMHRMIGREVKKDVRKLYGYDRFLASLEGDDPGSGRRRTPSLRAFVEGRRRYLVAHSALRGAWPEVRSVMHASVRTAEGSVLSVRARVGTDVPPERVILHYAVKKRGMYRTALLHDDGMHGDGAAGDGEFGGSLPPRKPGTKIRFYVEARAPASVGKTAFLPRKAEAGPRVHRLVK